MPDLNSLIMPPSVDSPVRTQFALRVPDGFLGSGRNGSGGICIRPVGRRRIFVQTDTGSVLGIELDRADNVQTVKKRMQTMLNVPMEQTALVFGDTVLKSDLSELRNDSPLLLTRGLQRSCSTPCLSPTVDTQLQVDGGQPLEVVGGLRCCAKMKKIIKEIVKAIECGVEPIPVSGGLGGAYLFRNCGGESVAIMKPTDEEAFAPNNPKGFVGKMLGQPGLKKAVRVGETGVREVAAYLLDHDHFAKVPPTVLVKVSHHMFHLNSSDAGHRGGSGKICSPVAKIASCQQFVHHDFDASDIGTLRFSVSAVHRIGILDIRIFNTDRHAGNILVRNALDFNSERAWACSNAHVNEALELTPIDHGLCLPEALEDPYFEWLHWPQASVPFSDEELEYIWRLDANKDVDMLRAELPMMREACFRVLLLSTTFLKKAAAAGLCLAEIGEMMSKDAMDETSQLELLCLQAKLQVENRFDQFSECSFGEEESPEQFEFEMDQEESNFTVAANRDQVLSGNNEYLGFPSGTLEQAGGSFLHREALMDTLGKGLAYPSVSSLSFASSRPQSCSILPTVIKPRSCERNQCPSAFLHYSASPNAPHMEGTRLKVVREGFPMLEEDDVSLPTKIMSTARTRYLNSRHAVFRSTSLRTNSGLERAHLSTGNGQKVEDVSLTVEEDKVNMPAAYLRLLKLDSLSPRAMSFKSVSFDKQGCSNYSERRISGIPAASASETTGKANAMGGANPLSLGDMSDEEWMYFMEVFGELLQEAFATRCQHNFSHRQRLGISCKF